ncbi:MAG: PVC-type heme-binding CxxCH protein [Pirellulales bacterium]
MTSSPNGVRTSLAFVFLATRFATLVAGVGLMPAVGFAQAQPALEFPRAAPVEPAQAAATLRAQHGFRMTLLAAEPLVMDPVAVEYDEQGRAWVVEMSDYPYTDKSTDKPFTERTTDLPLGRIRILTDRDGDGVFDDSRLFAEDLSWPTGLALWQGGVYVAATPDIWYLKDSDGDGRADIRRRVFTGFRKFNVQAVMNNLKWGPDGRIYGAGSSNGGTIRHAERDDAPVSLGRHDFRFSPRDERFELVSGGARFGNTFDDWGNRFLCNIRNPVQHVVLPQEYLSRRPHLPLRPAVHDVAAAGDTLPVFRISPVEPWRLFRAQRWAAEAGQSYPRSETHAAGYFTSSSGVTIYRGTAYPREFYGDAFVGEVAANAIHRQKVSVDGVTFRAQRADEKAEFVASTDNWFRPVNFVNAPDGTLHVLDMYRETIEHPWSIPDDIKAALDLESGRDRGRIYRLEPPGFSPPPIPRLHEATVEQLVAHLAHGDAWRRETAQRLLLERRDSTAAQPLRTQLRQHAQERARLHSLWTLAALDELQDDDLIAALQDESPGVREHAVRLSEPRLAASREVRELTIRRATDAALRVRFQVAWTLGTIDDEEDDSAVAGARLEISLRDAADPWVRSAILACPPRCAATLVDSLWNDARYAIDARTAPLVREAAAIAGARSQPEEVRRLLALLRTPPRGPLAADYSVAAFQNELLLGLSEGLLRTGKRLGTVIDRDSIDRQEVEQRLAQSRQLARDQNASLDLRLQALQLASLSDFADCRQTLTALLDARQPPQIQQAAVRALASFSDPSVAAILVEAYRGLTPSVRTEAVESLMVRAERHEALIEALESRRISTGQLSAVRRNQLLKHPSVEVRARAERLFAHDAPGPRREVIARYQAALKMKGDRARGREIYLRECAGCHRLDGQGHDVGPNLESIRHRLPEELLVNILDPNREVSPNYVEYVAELDDGRLLTGIVASETPAGVVLRRPQGVEDSLARSQLASLTAAGKSLMPEGLEQKLTPEELAALLSYLTP